MNIAIGDRVGFSKAWLQGTYTHTGPIALARGVVIAISKEGVATVRWNNPDIMRDRVHVDNLVTIRQIQMGE